MLLLGTAVPLLQINLSVHHRLQTAASITVTWVGGEHPSLLHRDIYVIFLKQHNPPLIKEGLG